MDYRVEQELNITKGRRVHQFNPPSKHLINEYEVVSDTVDGKVRTIVLKEVDLKVVKAKVNEIVAILMERMGETSKVVKGLLQDTLVDYQPEYLDKLLKKLLKGESVRVKEGCFKVVIGDGRTKGSEHLMLRE